MTKIDFFEKFTENLKIAGLYKNLLYFIDIGTNNNFNAVIVIIYHKNSENFNENLKILPIF